MSLDEFALIANYFAGIGRPSPTTRLGIGDDAAVVALPAGRALAVAMDTLVDGVHFDDALSPADIGYKALAVNLSDLAAMAAQPEWFLLSLTLPRADRDWLEGFAGGLAEAARDGPELIGGDTCRGPLAVTIQVAGSVADGAWLTRGGARPGDLVAVSGELGNAALGLALLRGEAAPPAALADKALRALRRPRARLELAPFLRAHASAAIDVSDGLVGDLRHVLERSGCGATLQLERLPVDDWIRRSDAWEYALVGGDDYEICCCLPGAARAELDAWNAAHPGCPLTAIGEITAAGYRLRAADGEQDLAARHGFRHFG